MLALAFQAGKVVEGAVPQLYGRETESKVLAACDGGKLTTQLQKVNVRDVLRQDTK